MPQLTWLDRAVLSTLSRLLPARFARCYPLSCREPCALDVETVWVPENPAHGC